DRPASDAHRRDPRPARGRDAGAPRAGLEAGGGVLRPRPDDGPGRRGGAPAVISVLYFSNSLARGGTEEHILTLLRGLDRSRFRAAFVCTPEVAEAMRRDVPADVELTPMRLRAPRHVGAARALRLLVRAHRVDVVHSHLFYASLFASPIAKLARVPLVVETPHVRESWRQGLKRHYVVDRVVGRF